MFSISIVLAHERTNSGTIVENIGRQLSGVNVIFKGSTIGTVSDVEGKYALSVDASSIIFVFSYGTQKKVNLTGSDSK